MELKCIDDLKVCPRNPRKISGEALAGLKVSLAMYGDIGGIVWNSRTGELVAGHQRLRALKALYGDGLKIEGDEIVAPTGERWGIRVVDWDEGTALGALVSANNPHISGEFDDGLEALLAELKAADEELFNGLCLDQLLELPDVEGDRGGSLVERFGVPPFSVLDARQAYWQERKAGWLARGIASGEGRGDDLLFSASSQPPVVYGLRNAMRERDGKDPSWDEVLAEAKRRGISTQAKTSIFDPVLCELAYRWFCPPGGLVLDPFAGGSVRGIVAGLLGRTYHGVDLRPEQVEANKLQAEQVGGKAWTEVDWIIGDSRTAEFPEECDLVFTCPPYGDLERYSDQPEDLSAMDEAGFDEAYRAILGRCARALKDDRFAVIVIGNVRDRGGFIRDLAGLTIAAMEGAGARLYNDAVLVTQAASAPIRAGKSFVGSRKLARVHQSVLVFVKGDPKRATEAVGPVEFGEPEGELEA